MYSRLQSATTALVFAALALTLAACASAPGMQMTKPEPGTPTASAVIETITPDLISRMREQAPALGSQVRDFMGQPQPYRIGAGDILSIVVWGHPELALPPTAVSPVSDGTATASGWTVDSRGRIQFAFVADGVQVAGLTEAQARDALVRELSRSLRNPQVTLRVQSYRSQRVHLEGEVRLPGVQAITDVPMTLPEALNRAGGATTLGDTSRLQLSRNGTTTTLNLPALVAQGFNPSQILLQPGDMLRVPSKEEARIFVLGEVQRPSPLNQRNGRLSLNEALGESGGINPNSGNAAQVYVIRTLAGAGQPTVYHLDAKSPVALVLGEQFELQPRDVVYVDPAPLANWNRIISLILPSAALANTTSSTLK